MHPIELLPLIIEFSNKRLNSRWQSGVVVDLVEPIGVAARDGAPIEYVFVGYTDPGQHKHAQVQQHAQYESDQQCAKTHAHNAAVPPRTVGIRSRRRRDGRHAVAILMRKSPSFLRIISAFSLIFVSRRSFFSRLLCRSLNWGDWRRSAALLFLCDLHKDAQWSFQ